MEDYKPPFCVDPVHPELASLVEESPIISDVWKRSYCREDRDLDETFKRVAKAIGKKEMILWDDGKHWALEGLFLHAMKEGLWMPGGRILAGAGTQNRVTLMNCYVSPDIPDNMEGIGDALKVALLTQQQGGGIGMDFSTLRPSGAVLRRTGSVASGPLPFMDMWDSMCATVRSAGDRRGAMMGTLCDTHPDLPAFIKAKHQKGRFTNFNVSVLVSDAFMAAVADDAEWELFFHVPPAGAGPHEFFEDDDGVKQYIYQKVRAQTLWDQITASTYVYSEPGVIFVDRINELNNLKYCEYIHCTNPCGEQPLPPNGTCNLGAINLARLVREPFTDRAWFDMATLKQVARLGVHFLDNVIDVTQYPTVEQATEEKQKRRLGLGVSGLAAALAQLKIRYGSGQAVSTTREIMRNICLSAYEESCQIAEEKGAFPLFDESEFFKGFAGEKLPPELLDRIHQHGIRNGVLLTIAPTGTTSILYGYIPSGIEPIFAHKQTRRVRSNNTNEYKTYEDIPDYTVALYKGITGHQGFDDLPDYIPESKDLTVEDHVKIQAACQEWVDASVSKTINCPEDISFEDFQQVYTLAYERGCKGCTTYKPSEVRGSILADPKANQRPEVLAGCTYKIKWPSWESAIYITINEHKDKPYEVFISSKDARYQEWIIALSVLISIIVRKADDPMQILSELRQIQSTHDSAFIGKKRYGSLLAKISEVLESHFASRHNKTVVTPKLAPQLCPKCNAQMVKREGCSICPSCSFTTCG